MISTLLAFVALSVAHAGVPADFAEALHSNIYHQVVLEDVLGEGTDAWDADPRYPNGTVNCMVWLQLLLAETYAKSQPALKNQIMDRIRYFGGVVSFGTRKHFTDHWLALDGAPFKRVDLRSCLPASAKPGHHDVDLNFRTFTKAQSYSCPLYRDDFTKQSFDFVQSKDFSACTKALAPGHYILFAVPSTKFLNRTIKTSGPMGLVHAVVLEIQSAELARQNGMEPRKPIVFHASTAGKHVKIENLDEFLRKSKTIHQGYALYTLDGSWLPTADSLAREKVAITAAAHHILQCEQALPKPRSENHK